MPRYSLDATPLAKSPALAKELGSTKPPFSLLTCLYAGAWILAAQTLVDLYSYFIGLQVLSKAPRALMTQGLGWVGMHPVYVFGLEWWIPLALVAAYLGWRLGRPGIAYCFLGIVLFLAVAHCFRGIAIRHNVFETADNVRRIAPPGLPPPLFWDLSFPLIGLAAASIGVASRRASLRRERTLPDTGPVLTTRELVSLAVILLSVGFLEVLTTLSTAGPRDRYSSYPVMSHGYAVLSLSLLFAALIPCREWLREGGLEP